MTQRPWRFLFFLTVLAVGYPLEVLDIDETRPEELTSENLEARAPERVVSGQVLTANCLMICTPEVHPPALAQWRAAATPRIDRGRRAMPLPTHQLPRAHLGKPVVPTDSPSSDLPCGRTS